MTEELNYADSIANKKINNAVAYWCNWADEQNAKLNKKKKKKKTKGENNGV